MDRAWVMPNILTRVCSTVKPVLKLNLRAGVHTKYRHVDLNLDAAVQHSCDCDVKKLNGMLGPESQLDPKIALPARTPQYHRHLMLISPPSSPGQDPSWKSGWQSKLELNTQWPYSAIDELKSHLKHTHRGEGILINAISVTRGPLADIPSTPGKASFLAIPDMKVYDVGSSELQEFANFVGEGEVQGHDKVSFQNFLQGANAASKLLDARASSSGGPAFREFRGQDYRRDITLVCGHHQRDARCGVIAPRLIQELDPLVDSDLAVISHIGGHKFAGNLILYKFLGIGSDKVAKVDGLWFGKILPSTVPTLIEHLERGEIITPWFRGGCSLKSKSHPV
ncbi:LAME_0D04676g1_1 [Lachancea meyersii CBS 8951]|uniref:Altered inheritance of mitochondria protein 32 n=1 Tax=Lachancea meyersii CBS 8951 TaxID=1266667 RepID=A0A1G4J889_9SACH|nr:LAME_0D04676g1_1 [Lachancea meyersii CBS 8951]